MILYFGHVMLRERRRGVPWIAVIPYPFWALATAISHPIAALCLALDIRHWLALARTRLQRLNSADPVERTCVK